MLVVSKYLNFTRNLSEETGKTQVWDVTNKQDVYLGRIGWMNHWRRYVFHPVVATLFDRDCMADIVAAIDKLMLKRKIESQNKKQDGL